jgi:hypothetical protein
MKRMQTPPTKNRAYGMCDRLFNSTLDADWTNPTNSLTWILLDYTT